MFELTTETAWVREFKTVRPEIEGARVRLRVSMLVRLGLELHSCDLSCLHEPMGERLVQHVLAAMCEAKDLEASKARFGLNWTKKPAKFAFAIKHRDQFVSFDGVVVSTPSIGWYEKGKDDERESEIGLEFQFSATTTSEARRILDTIYERGDAVHLTVTPRAEQK